MTPRPAETPYDGLARALARAWLPLLAEAQAPRGAIDSVLAEAAALNEPQLGWLSQAWFGLVRSRGEVTPAILQAQESDVHALRRTGSVRAIRLAEAALAAMLHRVPDRRDEAIALLQAHGDVQADPRPAIERLWTDVTLAMLLAATGQHEAALGVALKGEQLASVAAVAAAQFAASRALSYVLLSTGDVDDALVVLARELDASRRTGLGRISTRANLMIAWLLADQPLQALSMLQDDPWLVDTARQSADPTLACLIACALARGGQADAALAMLPTDGAPLDDDPALRANRAWARAAVHLAAGQPEAARDGLLRFIDETTAQQLTLSPMNGTQIHRMLSEALEALGDLPGALAALKASQRTVSPGWSPACACVCRR